MYKLGAIVSHLFTCSPRSSSPTIHPRECVLAWNEHLQEFPRTSWKSATSPCGSLCCTVWPFSTLLCRYSTVHSKIRDEVEGLYLEEPMKKHIAQSQNVLSSIRCLMFITFCNREIHLIAYYDWVINVFLSGKVCLTVHNSTSLIEHNTNFTCILEFFLSKTVSEECSP